MGENINILAGLMIVRRSILPEFSPSRGAAAAVKFSSTFAAFRCLSLQQNLRVRFSQKDWRDDTEDAALQVVRQIKSDYFI